MAMGGLPNSEDENDTLDDVFSEINITPLTDVFLVLLIIFMVTSSAIQHSSVKVNLPKGGEASSNTSETNEGITISLAVDGSIYLGKEKITLERLEDTIREQLGNQSNKRVLLSGDKAVTLESTIKIMNIAKRAGALKFGIVTEKE